MGVGVGVGEEGWGELKYITIIKNRVTLKKVSGTSTGGILQRNALTLQTELLTAESFF